MTEAGLVLPPGAEVGGPELLSLSWHHDEGHGRASGGQHITYLSGMKGKLGHAEAQRRT